MQDLFKETLRDPAQVTYLSMRTPRVKKPGRVCPVPSQTLRIHCYFCSETTCCPEQDLSAVVLFYNWEDCLRFFICLNIFMIEINSNFRGRSNISGYSRGRYRKRWVKVISLGNKCFEIFNVLFLCDILKYFDTEYSTAI